MRKLPLRVVSSPSCGHIPTHTFLQIIDYCQKIWVNKQKVNKQRNCASPGHFTPCLLVYAFYLKILELIEILLQSTVKLYEAFQSMCIQPKLPNTFKHISGYISKLNVFLKIGKTDTLKLRNSKKHDMHVKRKNPLQIFIK